METINQEYFGTDQNVSKMLLNAKNIASSKVPLIIIGENGVGKRSLSRFIHDHSSRREGPFIVVECQQENQEVENQLLGFREKDSGRFIKGALENGHKGTVVLSNIDSLNEDFQKKIHKILLELSDYDLDIRLMATTSKNLSKLVGAGRFYRALYIHISRSQINLLPLRERKEDILYITEKIIDELNLKSKKEIKITEECKEKLFNNYWTHNIKELILTLEEAHEKANELIDSSSLKIGEKKSSNVSFDGDEDGIRLMSLKEAERLLIRKALIHTSENRTQAAKILGVSIRTLRNKINEYRNEGSNYFVNLR